MNALQKSVQPKAKQALREIWQAETKVAAERAFDVILKTYEPKYPKETACLQKDRETLLTFYAFPGWHWESLRTTNPIESTFGHDSASDEADQGLSHSRWPVHMMFKLGRCAEKTWRRLRGFNQLPKAMERIHFVDGIEETATDSVAA